MKVATGHQFFEQFHERAAEIAPGLTWALIGEDGTWSDSIEECDLIVWAADAYTDDFVEAVTTLPAPRWAHTEDAGIDGHFYDVMRERKVVVTHSPGTNAPEVAEFAFSFVMWSAKRLGELAQHQREHRWRKLELESLSDKTLLVVGLGAIGARVAAYGKAFGMRVLGIRREPSPVEQVDQQGTLDDLHRFLGEADFVVLALPFSPTTSGLMGKETLAGMKTGATLVNVARGALVDTAALTEALAAGKLRHACLDVLPTEPWPADDPLWDVPDLFITPHNASSSPLYLTRVGELWLENLKRYVQGESMLNRAF